MKRFGLFNFHFCISSVGCIFLFRPRASQTTSRTPGVTSKALTLGIRYQGDPFVILLRGLFMGSCITERWV